MSKINHGFIIRKEDGTVLFSRPAIYPSKQAAQRIAQEVLDENTSSSNPNKLTPEQALKCKFEYTTKAVETNLAVVR